MLTLAGALCASSTPSFVYGQHEFIENFVVYLLPAIYAVYILFIYLYSPHLCLLER